MDLPYYPINDFGPLMKGLAIGGLGIIHVFLAQFAIGGGMLLCYLQWLAQTGRCRQARAFVDGYFKVLVLVSFVLGAVTGVGMWFTTIQVSPRTIGMMVDEFHWIWAIEWTFFSLEVTAGYCFYRYGKRLNDSSRMALLSLYATAAWFSLFWINGILSWQLTPGGWTETGHVWAGFFNPSFFPSLIFRTVTSMAIAAFAACLVINLMPEGNREDRTILLRKAAHFLAPLGLMPLLGVWYFATIPADSRAYVMGGSAAMTLFMSLAVLVSFLIGAYSLLALLKRTMYMNGATSLLLLALTLVATAGGEFVREGVRKPYTVRMALYSNSIRPDEIEHLRRVGSVTNDPYPLLEAEELPNEQLRLGAKVYRFQCSICHTTSGVNGLKELTHAWSPEQKRLMIAQLQRTKPFMPPFAGSAEELEALVQYLQWHGEGQPDDWPETHDEEVLAQIQQWLDEAGTQAGQAHTGDVANSGGEQ